MQKGILNPWTNHFVNLLMKIQRKITSIWLMIWLCQLKFRSSHRPPLINKDKKKEWWKLFTRCRLKCRSFKQKMCSSWKRHLPAESCTLHHSRRVGATWTAMSKWKDKWQIDLQVQLKNLSNHLFIIKVRWFPTEVKREILRTIFKR